MFFPPPSGRKNFPGAIDQRPKHPKTQIFFANCFFPFFFLLFFNSPQFLPLQNPKIFFFRGFPPPSPQNPLWPSHIHLKIGKMWKINGRFFQKKCGLIKNFFFNFYKSRVFFLGLGPFAPFINRGFFLTKLAHPPLFEKPEKKKTKKTPKNCGFFF